MLWEIARDPYFGVLPIASIGGIANWRDAAEFRTLGAGSVQVCTAAMHKGFKIVEDMIDGLGYWMDEKGYRTLDDFRAAAIPNVTDWQQLDMNYEIVARINQRSEEHTSELPSLMRISYAVFCLKKKNK